jgi:ABC-type polar amino acid transport system ATPase subunit
MALSCTNISKSYGDISVLCDASITIYAGQLHVILGPSGSGKTTLFRILSLLEPADSGRIELDGQEFRHLPLYGQNAWRKNLAYRKRVSLVFQQLFMWPHISLKESIELGARVDTWKKHVDGLGLTDVLHRFPNQVSLGQKQRAAFLRALATGADFLFFDEITSALDGDATSAVLRIIDELLDAGKGIILVTHNPERLSNQKYTLHNISDGQLINGRDFR